MHKPGDQRRLQPGLSWDNVRAETGTQAGGNGRNTAGSVPGRQPGHHRDSRRRPEQQDMRRAQAPAPHNARSFARAACTPRTWQTTSRVGGSIADSPHQPSIVICRYSNCTSQVLYRHSCADQPRFGQDRFGPQDDRCCPMLRQTLQMSTQIGRCWPSFANIVANFDQHWPTLAKSGPKWPVSTNT